MSTCERFRAEHPVCTYASLSDLTAHARACPDQGCVADLWSEVALRAHNAERDAEAHLSVLRSRKSAERRLTGAVARILAATTGRKTVPRADLEDAYRAIVIHGQDWEGPQ